MGRQHGEEITTFWCSGVTRILKEVWPDGETNKLTVGVDIKKTVKAATSIWIKENPKETGTNLNSTGLLAGENQTFQTKIKELIGTTMDLLAEKLNLKGSPDIARKYFTGKD